jgi:protease I
MSTSETRLLAFVGDDYEDLELWYPVLRAQEAGVAVVMAGQKQGATYRGKHGYPAVSDAAVAQIRGEDFDGVLVPGGWMPDKLRRDAHVLALVRHFADAGKLIATICHGPWILISAGVCPGVRMTSTPGIRDDVTNAGATWIDAPVVVDRAIVSSRRPADLPAFAAAMLPVLLAKRRSGEG